jgi:hypothetical protein
MRPEVQQLLELLAEEIAAEMAQETEEPTCPPPAAPPAVVWIASPASTEALDGRVMFTYPITRMG